MSVVPFYGKKDESSTCATMTHCRKTANRATSKLFGSDFYWLTSSDRAFENVTFKVFSIFIKVRKRDRNIVMIAIVGNRRHENMNESFLLDCSI